MVTAHASRRTFSGVISPAPTGARLKGIRNVDPTPRPRTCREAPLSDSAGGSGPRLVERLGCSVNRQACHTHEFNPDSLVVFGPVSGAVASSDHRAAPQFLTGFVADHVRIPVCMPFYTSMCQLRLINKTCGAVVSIRVLGRRVVASVMDAVPPAAHVGGTCAGDLAEQILAKSPVVGRRAATLRKGRQLGPSRRCAGLSIIPDRDVTIARLSPSTATMIDPRRKGDGPMPTEYRAPSRRRMREYIAAFPVFERTAPQNRKAVR
jgi:hypothetical protein